MAKVTKEELITKINDYEGVSDDVKIELMEDITDSFDDTELTELQEEIKNTNGVVKKKMMSMKFMKKKSILMLKKFKGGSK